MRNRSRRDFVGAIAGGSLLACLGTDAPGKDSIALPRSIFLSPEASEPEKWAAEELSAHLEKMTGARLPVAASATIPDAPVIAVGGSAVTDRLRIEIPQGESCLLKTEGRTLILAGGRQRGTMYGVFCFLEKLGCRWYTSDVARTPALRHLALAPLDELTRPAFDYREVFFTEAQGREWSARNRLNGHFHRLDESVGGKISYMPFAHSFYDLVSPDRYFETHPEYFALVGGHRRGRNAQLCLTNPDIVELATQAAQKWLTENPSGSIVSISQNDGAGWCECDPCREVVRGEGGAISGLVLRFVNRVAARVAESHPGKLVDTLAYQKSADPPASTKPLPNVQIRLCPIDTCQVHPYGTCIYNRTFEEQLAGWTRIAPRLVVWQYSINFAHFLLPFPNEQELISDIPRFHRAGVSGMFVEGAVSEGGGGENAEWRAYLAARLLWNPDVDVNAETRGFLHSVYGPAAPLMARYFALRQKEIAPGEHLWIDQNVDAPYLTSGFLGEARELLNRAYREAAPGPPRRRIERCALSLDYIEVMRRRRCRVQGALYSPDDLERVNIDTRTFVQKAESLGVTHLREGYPLKEQAAAYDRFARAYPALALHEGGRTVDFVPDLGARIITCGSSRVPNILRVPDPGEFAYPFTGGLYVSLTSDYSSTEQQEVAWRAGPAENGAVSLLGRSERGFDLEMHIGAQNGVLRVHVTATNRGPEPQPAALRCQAEFAAEASRRASLRYATVSGENRRVGLEAPDGSLMLAGDERPHEQWTLVLAESTRKIHNRFRAREVGQCGIRWSLRGSPRATVFLWSPEIVLAPGQSVSLESQYEIDESAIR